TYDAGLHGQPVLFCLDRAGITGDDGASHHGLFDMALLSKVPGMTIFAPSSTSELTVMFRDAMTIEGGPIAIRWSKVAARAGDPAEVGHGLNARRLHEGDGRVCILAVGHLLEAAEGAAALLSADGVDATLWDVRVVKPL